MAANAQKLAQIQQFNARQQAAAVKAQQPAVPAAGLIAHKNMSASDIALIQKSQDKTQTLTADEAIHLKALETKENLRISDEQKATAAAAALEQQRKDAKLGERVVLETRQALAAAGSPIEPAANWFAHLPTPGSLATIVILLIIFVLAIVPVDDQGTTRIKLVWLTLTGKTHLRYQEGGSSSSNTTTTQTQQFNPVIAQQPILQQYNPNVPATPTISTGPSNQPYTIPNNILPIFGPLFGEAM